MSFWEDYNHWAAGAGREFVSVILDPLHVEPTVRPVAAVAQRHYLQARLVKLFFKKDGERLQRLHPAVHSHLRFGTGARSVEISRLVEPATSRDRSFTEGALLIPTTPYNGGSISINAGLCSALSAGDLRKFIDAAVKGTSIRQFLENDLISPELEFSGSFAEGKLKSGYMAVIRAVEGEFDPTGLRVVDDRLFVSSGGHTPEKAPLEKHDYLLFFVDVFEDRGDWESLTTIQTPFQQSLAVLTEEGDEVEADVYLRQAMMETYESPDLTAADKRRLILGMKTVVEDVKNGPIVKSWRGGKPTLGRIVEESISVDQALREPELTIDEILGMTGSMQGERTRGGISLGQESTWPEEGEAEALELAEPSTPSQPRQFYFSLEGDGVVGDQVKFGANVDLVFNYTFLPVDKVAGLFKVAGEELLSVVRESAPLGISIIPKGFLVRDSNWYQTARFINGNLENPIRFLLKASDVEVEDAGVHVTFYKGGKALYQFFLPMTLTQNPSAVILERATSESLELDLDEIDQTSVRLPRMASMTIKADADRITVYYQDLRNVGLELPLIATLSRITRPSLAAKLLSIQAEISAVAGHTIWSVDGDPLEPPTTSSKQKAYRECTEAVVSAGADLYATLTEDAGFKPILDRINQLPSGSRISVATDCAFVPWEVFYPRPYSKRWSEAVKQQNPIQIQELWGYKYLFECQPLDENYKSPAKYRQSGVPFVSYNLNPTIDGSFSGVTFQPVKAQETWAAEYLAQHHRIEVRNTGVAIQEALSAPGYEADLIYLYCHGRSEQVFQPGQIESLQLDQDLLFQPQDFPPDHVFPRAPVIFLNSCSSGAISPLSFSNFLSKFRKCRAVGLISTSFTIPALFAAAFGNEMIRPYLQDRDSSLGETLLDLRRNLLNHQNPLGLFYSLQCPMDITAPKSK